MHYQHTDLGYLFVADFRYWLIRKSLIFSRFLAVEIGAQLLCGTAYMRVYTE